MTALTILMLATAYLLGSISSAILICRVFALPDPRERGSGNPGATNVYRLGGRIPALLVLICDILKGTLPVYGSYFLGIEPIYLGLIGVAACLGHMFPLFFQFKGGKAVATAFGAMLPIGLGLAGFVDPVLDCCGIRQWLFFPWRHHRCGFSAIFHLAYKTRLQSARGDVIGFDNFATQR